MDSREENLPKWAKELISNLRKKIEYGDEPYVKELATLRVQYELYKRRYEAMTELLECAAYGNHKTAKEIVEILNTYDLVLSQKEN